MKPDQAFFLLQTDLPVLEREHGITSQILKALPVEKGDYRPDPCAKSAIDLAVHVALSENVFLSGVANGMFDFTSGRPDFMKTTADVVSWHTETFAANLVLLKALTPEQCAKIMDFRGMFQMPAVAFLGFTMRHSIHHRGQLSTYLRPMGAKVPAIYGESYDSAEARKAAQAN